MGVCGKYAVHRWTRASSPKNKVCGRCGLPFSDRDEGRIESPPRQVISFSNAKKTRKNRISPLK
jgi:hypothetical protein